MPEFWDIFYFLNDEATESISWYTIFQLYFLFHVFLCTSMLLCSSLFLTPMTVCDDVELVGKKILLLTAHPDDECMFFAPSVVRLSKTSEVFILCVTTGRFKVDFHGLQFSQCGFSAPSVQFLDSFLGME